MIARICKLHEIIGGHCYDDDYDVDVSWTVKLHEYGEQKDPTRDSATDGPLPTWRRINLRTRLWAPQLTSVLVNFLNPFVTMVDNMIDF